MCDLLASYVTLSTCTLHQWRIQMLVILPLPTHYFALSHISHAFHSLSDLPSHPSVVTKLGLGSLGIAVSSLSGFHHTAAPKRLGCAVSPENIIKLLT